MGIDDDWQAYDTAVVSQKPATIEEHNPPPRATTVKIICGIYNVNNMVSDNVLNVNMDMIARSAHRHAKNASTEMESNHARDTCKNIACIYFLLGEFERVIKPVTMCTYDQGA